MGAARARLWRALAQAGDHDRQDGLEDIVVGDQREFAYTRRLRASVPRPGRKPARRA